MANRLGVTARARPELLAGPRSGGGVGDGHGSAYSTLAERGRRIDPYVIRRVESADGEVLYDSGGEVTGEQVIDPEVADTVNSVLTGVLSDGTGTGADLGVPAAGKTGTTSDNKDAWFAGYTCKMTAVVWMGYEQPRADDLLQGPGGVRRHASPPRSGATSWPRRSGTTSRASSPRPMPVTAW
jgi:membrane peptidoglycan carboxypeptidase